MGYLVLARKYRPQSFQDMAGQEHVVRTLSNALKTGQLAHAFLFTGPRGVGKTTCARLVAKCLDCERGPTAEPCGVCAPCVEIAEGRCVDVVEIDAASNNGVDNVRDIVEAVKYRPARDRFKVFVVDEVHMLSTGAFNALLKTLEEPPEHVKFVLATTDVHKVPETIVSRCQRFDFRRLTQQQLVDQLRKVASAEAMRISDPALALLARTAEGGMRDALSLLDQVRAACGDEADDAAVAEAAGAVDAGAVSRLAGALLRRDGGAVLAEVGGLHARGQEMKRVGEELVRHLRNVVVTRLVPDAPLDLTDVERRDVQAQSKDASPAQLTRLFDLAQRAVLEVRQSEQPRYALEVALLKACFLAPGSEVQDLIARVESLAGGGAGPGPAGGGSAGGPSSTRLAGAGHPAAHGSTRVRPPDRESKQPPGVEHARSVGDPAASSEPPGVPVAAPPAQGWTPVEAPAPAAAGDAWRTAVGEVERAIPSAANALKQAAVQALAGGEISLRLPGRVAFATVERRRADVEAILTRVFGRPMRLLLAEAAAGEVPGAAAVAGRPARSLADQDKAERDARSVQVKAVAREHPNIQEAARILDGEIGKIDEL